MGRLNIREFVEYHTKNWPVACSDGVTEGEIHSFVYYAGHAEKFEEPVTAEAARFRYLEGHMPECVECNGIYEHIQSDGKRLRRFMEKEFGKKDNTPKPS